MKNLKFIFLFFLTILFVEGGVFAQKDFDPKYDRSRMSYVPGIEVIRGETQVIVPRHESPCPNGTVFKFNNGDIQVYDRRSSDGGKTWYKVEHILEASTYQYPEPDGEVVMFVSEEYTYSYYPEVIYTSGRPENLMAETNQKGVFKAKFFRSKDNSLSWVEDTAKIFLPEDLNDWSDDWSRVLCRKIVRIGDGSLLMSMYGTSKRKGIGSSYDAFVIRSTDRGKTWHYLSTIAFGLIKRVRSEGFNETSLLVLPDGQILSFIRSGGSYEYALGSYNNDPSAKMPFNAAQFTPIYMSRSIDGGKTWSNADPVAPFGVWPDAVLMNNGIIAMSYGRPGTWIVFSNNEGKSWGPIIQFYNDLFPPDCGNYLSLAEVAPNILLAVYGRTDPNNCWQSEIVGTYFHVKRVDE